MVWWGIMCVVLTALAAAFVGSFAGVLSGIEWHTWTEQRRRVREIRSKRADITAAWERDSL